MHAFRIKHYRLRVEKDLSAETTLTGKQVTIKCNFFTVG